MKNTHIPYHRNLRLGLGIAAIATAGLLSAFPALAETTDKTTWTTKNNQLFVSTNDGAPEKIFLKGTCYSPTPIGGATYEPGIGDWFYYNFAGIWKDKDLPAMKAAGMNNLRTYFWWALPPPRDIKTWKDEWKKLEAADKQRVAKGLPRTFDHTPFLDECYKNGIYVIIGLAVNGGELFEGAMNEEFFEFFKFNAQKIAELYGDHPAVIGICVGNEQNQSQRNSSMEFLSKQGEIANIFKKAAPGKLAMSAFQNDTSLLTTQVEGRPFGEVYAKYFDMWGLNIYAGMDSTLATFKREIINKPYALPLIVSEWGANVGAVKPGTGELGPPAGNAQPAERTDFTEPLAELEKNWGYITDNLDFVVGLQYFSWTDEWWKNFTDPNYVFYTDQQVSDVDLSSGLRKVQLPDAEWVRINQNDPGSWKKWRVENDKGQWRAIDGKMIYPTFVFRQEASHDPAWPEEMWGLNRISPKNRNPEIGAQRMPPFNEYGYIYNVDERHPRPTLTKLTELYKALKLD